MKYLLILTLLLFLNAFPVPCSHAGLSLIIYDDVRSAPVGFPLYISFSLRNDSAVPLTLPLKYSQNMQLTIRDHQGRQLKECGLSETEMQGMLLVQIEPQHEHFKTIKLNHAFGFALTEGNYTLTVTYTSPDASPLANPKTTEGDPVPSWKGILTSEVVPLTVTAPLTPEDDKAYELIKRYGPFPETTMYPVAEELFAKYPESIYAAYAIINGAFAKTEKFPTAAELIVVLKKKYQNTYVEQLLTEKEAALAFNLKDLDKCLTIIQAIDKKWPRTGIAERNKLLVPQILHCKRNHDQCRQTQYDALKADE